MTLAVAGCGGNKVKGDGPPSGSARIPDMPGDAVPKPEPRSRYGNGPVYEVLGKRYEVMPSSNGYQERGVASWYGEKFHGNLTSNREVYDMYGMTAAHKTLPLPTYVEVRNLRNDKSIIVRVNDRGPFVHNRIIDLSYTAAMKLDMVQDGTSLVEVTAISFEEPQGDRPVRTTMFPEPTSGKSSDAGIHDVFIQVGAFGDRANAERRQQELRSANIENAFIHEERSRERVLYRVRIGPVTDVVQYDSLVDELAAIGIHDPYLISE
jgi:rare lipoprotein A